MNNFAIIPLPILVMIWLLNRRRQPKGKLEMFQYSLMRKELDGLEAALPLPHNRMDRWLMRRVMSWIQEEKLSIYILQRAMVVAEMVVPGGEE